MTDAVRRIRSCDEEKQPEIEELARTHYVRIYRICLGLCGNAPDAEDLAQETFVVALSQMSSFRRQAGMYTWLVGIALNLARQFRRKKGWVAARKHPLRATFASRDQGPEAQAETRESTELVRQAIAGLPLKYRSVLLLRELEGLSYKEIARVLGCSIGTVESRLFRARERLRRRIGQGPLRELA